MLKRIFGFVPALTVLGLAACSQQAGAPTAIAQAPRSDNEFKGVIKLDVRDSKADWAPFTPKKAPDGAPNFLFILYDDTGLAAWSPYGGRINMPTLDKLAASGLTYTHGIRPRYARRRGRRSSPAATTM